MRQVKFQTSLLRQALLWLLELVISHRLQLPLSH
jgi:hypothetical protein